MQAQSHGFESARGVPTNGWDLSKASPYNVDRSGQSQRRSANMDNQASEPYQAAAISGRELKQLEDEMRRSAAEMRESAGAGGNRSAEAMLLSNPNGNGNGGLVDSSSSMTSQGSGSSLLGNSATGNTATGNPSAGNRTSSDPPSLLGQSGREASMGDFLNQSHGKPGAGDATSSGSDGMSLSNPSGMSDVSASGSSANAADANSGKSADQSNASTGFTMPSDVASSSGDSGAGDSGAGDSQTGSDADVKGSNGGTSGTQSSGQASASGSTQSGASQGSAGAGGSSQPPAEGQIGGSAPPQNPNLVKPNKRDWALPDSVAQSRGNSIVRTIRVVCDDGQFVLLGSAMSGGTEVFGFTDKPVSTATLELATAVRDRIDRWGPSLPGGRWSPVLDVEVIPGGEARFEQLRKLMQGSGVEVVGKVAQ